MAKVKFVTDGEKPLKINWVFRVDDIQNIKADKAYKVIAIDKDSSLAVIVPYSDIKNINFTGSRHRNSVHKKIKTSISLYAKVNVYGTHLDNLDKGERVKEENANKNLEKEEKIRALGLGEKLEDVLISIIKDYEEKLHSDMLERFVDALSKLGLDGIFYKCEFKEMNMSDIAKVSLKTLSNQGWSFCFELNGKYYFQRPRLKKK